MRVLLALDNDAGKFGGVGDDHAQSAVRFDDVDAMNINLIETGFLSCGRFLPAESTQQRHDEDNGKHTGVDHQKALSPREIGILILLGWSHGASDLFVVLANQLEIKLQSKLNHTRIQNGRANDLPKGRSGKVRVWSAEFRMVEQIVELGPELKVR